MRARRLSLVDFAQDQLEPDDFAEEPASQAQWFDPTPRASNGGTPDRYASGGYNGQRQGSRNVVQGQRTGSAWTPAEDQELMRVRHEHGSWEDKAMRFSTNRSANAMRQRAADPSFGPPSAAADGFPSQLDLRLEDHQRQRQLAGATGASAAQSQDHDIKLFLKRVKETYRHTPGDRTYDTFVKVLTQYDNTAGVDATNAVTTVMQQAHSLFWNDPSLLVGFNTFLPAGYDMRNFERPVGPIWEVMGRVSEAVAQAPTDYKWLWQMYCTAANQCRAILERFGVYSQRFKPLHDWLIRAAGEVRDLGADLGAVPTDGSDPRAAGMIAQHKAGIAQLLQQHVTPRSTVQPQQAHPGSRQIAQADRYRQHQHQQQMEAQRAHQQLGMQMLPTEAGQTNQPSQALTMASRHPHGQTPVDRAASPMLSLQEIGQHDLESLHKQIKKTRPKRIKNSYQVYVNDCMAHYRQQGTVINVVDMKQTCAATWKTMRPEQKAPYEAKMVQIKLRYSSELQAWESEHKAQYDRVTAELKRRAMQQQQRRQQQQRSLQQQHSLQRQQHPLQQNPLQRSPFIQVTFQKEGQMGLVFNKSSPIPLPVASLVDGLAVQDGTVVCGMQLFGVKSFVTGTGINVSAMPYEEVLRTVREAGRPVTLVFKLPQADWTQAGNGCLCRSCNPRPTTPAAQPAQPAALQAGAQAAGHGRGRGGVARGRGRARGRGTTAGEGAIIGLSGGASVLRAAPTEPRAVAAADAPSTGADLTVPQAQDFSGGSQERTTGVVEKQTVMPHAPRDESPSTVKLPQQIGAPQTGAAGEAAATAVTGGAKANDEAGNDPVAAPRWGPAPRKPSDKHFLPQDLRCGSCECCRAKLNCCRSPRPSPISGRVPPACPHGAAPNAGSDAPAPASAAAYAFSLPTKPTANGPVSVAVPQLDGSFDIEVPQQQQVPPAIPLATTPEGEPEDHFPASTTYGATSVAAAAAAAAAVAGARGGSQATAVGAASTVSLSYAQILAKMPPNPDTETLTTVFMRDELRSLLKHNKISYHKPGKANSFKSKVEMAADVLRLIEGGMRSPTACPASFEHRRGEKTAPPVQATAQKAARSVKTAAQQSPQTSRTHSAPTTLASSRDTLPKPRQVSSEEQEEQERRFAEWEAELPEILSHEPPPGSHESDPRRCVLCHQQGDRAVEGSLLYAGIEKEGGSSRAAVRIRPIRFEICGRFCLSVRCNWLGRGAGSTPTARCGALRSMRTRWTTATSC